MPEKQCDQICFRKSSLTSAWTVGRRGASQWQWSSGLNLALNLVPAMKIEEGKES